MSESFSPLKRHPHKRSIVAGLGIVFFLLVILSVVYEAEDKLGLFKKHLRSTSLPKAMLDYGTKGDILKSLDLVYQTPNNDSRYNNTLSDSTKETGERSTVFRRKRQIGEHLYQANLQGDDGLPSRLRNPPSDKPLTLSLHLTGTLAEAAFNRPKWPQSHDRTLQEASGTITVYQQSTQTFAGNIGVRFGSDGNPDMSYRVIFRSRYGVEHMPSSALFADSDASTLESFIINPLTPRKNWLALHLAQRAGLLVPDHSLANLILNDGIEGTVLVREAVNRRQWQQRNSTRDFLFYRAGDFASDPEFANFQRFRKWFLKNRAAINVETLSKVIDVAQLTRQMIFMMYCGSSDWHKWAFTRDLASGNRWRWIIWDLQSCFSDRWRTSTSGLSTQDGVGLVVRYDENKNHWRATHPDLRAEIFATLINRDPTYVSYVSSVAERLLQQELAFEQLSLPVDFNDMADSPTPLTHAALTPEQFEIFLKERPAQLLKQLEPLLSQ